jgi:hypothetical protein
MFCPVTDNRLRKRTGRISQFVAGRSFVLYKTED